MRSLMIEILVLFGMSLLTFGIIADAAGPAQADFDICNAEAHTRAASPSAAPVTQPPATPSPARTTGTGAGTGAGRITDSTSPGTPSASDDLSRGMAAAGQADPAFRHAYVACMKRRGF